MCPFLASYTLSLNGNLLSQARGERAALARQSAVAMSEVMSDEKFAMALQEVHSLTQQLHTQEEEYKQKIQKLKVI